jgi:hypothetical protein
VPKTEIAKRDRGYGKRRRTSLVSRHDRHTVKVHSCARCYPGSVSLEGGAKGESTATTNDV